MKSEARLWVEKMEPGDLFDLDDAATVLRGRSRDAVQKAVARLCEGDDPLVGRVCRGFYTRRRNGFGRPAEQLPLRVWRQLSWRVAGAGAGMSGPYVMNRIGWSTQIPCNIWISVVADPRASRGSPRSSLVVPTNCA